MSTHWVESFFSTQWIRFYNAAAREFFYHTEVDEEEASQQAQEHLLIQLQKMDDRASDPLVKTIYKNALRDLYRKHFGRHRPPTWIQALGAKWIQVWQWFCLQGMPITEITRHVENEYQYQAEQLVEKIRQTDGCPNKRSQSVSMQEPIKSQESDGDKLGDFISDGTGQAHEDLDSEQIKLIISSLLSMGSQGENQQWDDQWVGEFLKKKAHISEKLKLSNDEILMLKMRFEEDESINDIAEALFKPAYQIRRDLKKALQKMRQILHQLNLDEYHLLG